MHWTEQLASHKRQELGMQGFACAQDSDRLLEAERSRGLQVQMTTDCCCLAEIRPGRGAWRMKIAAFAPVAQVADLIIHEVGHLYTRSGMTAICSQCYSWWWAARDELNAALWAAHFRLPTDLMLLLLRKNPSWEDLSWNCQAPAGLIALKLRSLGKMGEAYERCAGRPLFRPDAPPLASRTYRAEIRSENSWQWRVGIYCPATGRRWALQRAANPVRLEPLYDALAWDLVAVTEHQFWRKWWDRLEPVETRKNIVTWSNPKRA